MQGLILTQLIIYVYTHTYIYIYTHTMYNIEHICNNECVDPKMLRIVMSVR